MTPALAPEYIEKVKTLEIVLSIAMALLPSLSLHRSPVFRDHFSPERKDRHNKCTIGSGNHTGLLILMVGNASESPVFRILHTVPVYTSAMILA